MDKLDKFIEILKDYDNFLFIEVDGNINKDIIKFMNGKKVDIYVVGILVLFNDKFLILYKDKIEELKESIK